MLYIQFSISYIKTNVKRVRLRSLHIYYNCTAFNDKTVMQYGNIIKDGVHSLSFEHHVDMSGGDESSKTMLIKL